MKYRGNTKFVSNETIQKILTTDGQARPRNWTPVNEIEEQEYARYAEAGYDLNAVNWWVYEKQDLDIDIALPWATNIHWWITKLTPGQFMPMHTDPHTHDKKCRRYWIPLQDYVPGHIFLYGSELVADYIANDIFEYYDAQDLHGAANISHTPRLVLQITEYY